MKLTVWSILGIIAAVFALFWVYEANPGNIFQRGNVQPAA